uniref:Uncharacterized protein n=1 Tax=Tanacetum cinerariifolium TaxID=118510 RepID=A0A699IQF8_TANCI|nr:hypothetical protein [Tanacetum cinerariifolium]
MDSAAAKLCQGDSSEFYLITEIARNREKTRSLPKVAYMANCNPNRMPVDTESKLGSERDPISDPTLYRNLAGGLQYLTFTHPHISYAVQQVFLHMHDPRERSPVAYIDVDWAGYATTKRSTYGYCVFLRDNLLSWSAKRQHNLSRSSAQLSTEVFLLLLSKLSGFTKHIEIHIHFVCDMVDRSQVHVLYVPSRYQCVDILTKGLPSALFEEFRTSLSVRPSSAQTTRAY